MKSFPLVTIGVALYNGAKYLVETLESINRQTYENIQIVIVDDGSSDNSYELCKNWAPQSRFSVLISKNYSNRGLPATRNILVSQATGKYINFFDQDDVMLPSRIENDVKFFEQQPEDVAFIFSRVKLINAEGKLLPQDYFDRIHFKGFPVESIFLELTKMNFISAPTVVVRTHILKQNGGYDDTLQFDDWDMWLRLTKDFQASFQDSFLTYYRVHDSSMMANRNATQTIIRNKANIRMFKKHLHHSAKYDKAIYSKLRELSVYSYFLGDQDSSEILQDYLKIGFDAKVWVYHKLSCLGIKHHSFIKNLIIPGKG